MKYCEHKRVSQFPFLRDNCNSIQQCFDPTLHKKLCSKSSMNMIKTVRLRAQLLEKLLKMFSNLKVIVLVRDPRAVLNSRWSGYFGWCGDKPHCREVSSFCSELSNDITRIITLADTYSNNIKIVRYEDLVTNKTLILTNTLKTLGISVTYQRISNFFSAIESDTKFIYNMDKIGLMSYRKDPLHVAKKWLGTVPEKVVKLIEEKCELPMKLLGYPDRHSIFSRGPIVVKAHENVQNILIQ